MMLGGEGREHGLAVLLALRQRRLGPQRALGRRGSRDRVPHGIRRYRDPLAALGGSSSTSTGTSEPTSSQLSRRTRSRKNSQIARPPAIVGNATSTPAIPYSSPPARRPKITSSGWSLSALAMTFGTTMWPSTW